MTIEYPLILCVRLPIHHDIEFLIDNESSLIGPIQHPQSRKCSAILVAILYSSVDWFHARPYPGNMVCYGSIYVEPPIIDGLSYLFFSFKFTNNWYERWLLGLNNPFCMIKLEMILKKIKKKLCYSILILICACLYFYIEYNMSSQLFALSIPFR